MKLILHARHDAVATIRNLSFPVPAIIAPAAGLIRCSHRGMSRLVRPAQRLALRSFTPIAIEFGSNAAVVIELPADLLRACERGIEDTPRPLTSLLARHVLAAPQRDWTLDAFACIAGISRAVLSRRLFTEGTSFREIVRSHRLVRLLLDLPKVALHERTMAPQYGFGDRCQFEDAIFEHFGLPLAQLRRLVTDGANGTEGVEGWTKDGRESPAPQFRWHLPPAAAIQCDRPPV